MATVGYTIHGPRGCGPEELFGEHADSAVQEDGGWVLRMESQAAALDLARTLARDWSPAMGDTSGVRYTVVDPEGCVVKVYERVCRP